MGPSRQSWRDRVLPPPKRAPQSHGAMFWHIRLELLARHRLERNHSCYMPELERRVKFEEAISAKRRGWHSPFRTICAAGFWKPMRQEREAFAPVELYDCRPSYE